MPQINDDWVLSIPLVTENAAGGVVTAPPGDTYAASTDSASLAASIGTMGDGNTPALILTPMVVASTGITVTVTDSTGLAAYVDMWDIVPDVGPVKLDIDMSASTHIMQPTPTNPGP